MKKRITLLTLVLGFFAQAQVKIGNNQTFFTSPNALLELEATTKALLITRVANTAAIATPTNGMMIYDLSSNCVKGYQNGAWTDCGFILASTNGTATVSSWSCNTASNGGLGVGTSVTSVTQTVTASVTAVGTYNISTTANGVTFAGSGTFANTGTQNIILTATGTPLAIGTNAFTLNTTPNCSFNRTTENISNDCNLNGFAGTYKAATAFTGANTFTVTVKNTSGSSATIAFANADLVLSGASAGLTVTATSPASVTLSVGQSQLITYTLSGTPAACGALIATWTKTSLTCTKTINITPSFINCASGSWTTGPIPNPATTGLINGTAYLGSYSIPYTGGGCNVAAESISINGLTFSTPATTLTSSGNIIYSLSGTYTGGGGIVTFNTSYGCSVNIGTYLLSCNAIKTANPTATDGIYFIDPDGAAAGFAPMQAQCDMTTDGGGWTLILNYLHLGGTNPVNNESRTTLPIIGSSTLGVDESANTSTWGGASLALKTAISYSSMIFYGKTSSHTRLMNFKTSLSGVITYSKTGNTGDFTGIQTSFTPLTGHTSTIPASANSFFNGQGVNALTSFPMFKSDATGSWGIYGFSTRWEVDDWPNSAANSTLHRVWVR
jgi:hypothetical protein